MPTYSTKETEEMVLKIIRAFARRDHPGRFNIIFKRVAEAKGLSYAADKNRYDNFFETCEGIFFTCLDTSKSDWKSWPEKARRYLGIPKAPPKPRPAKPIARPTQQRRVPF